MFREEINRTVRKVREGCPKVAAHIELPTWRRGATPQGLQCCPSLAFPLEQPIQYSRAAFPTAATPEVGSIYTARFAWLSYSCTFFTAAAYTFLLSPCYSFPLAASAGARGESDLKLVRAEWCAMSQLLLMMNKGSSLCRQGNTLESWTMYRGAWKESKCQKLEWKNRGVCVKSVSSFQVQFCFYFFLK